MFLELAHTQLKAYQKALEINRYCFQLTKKFPVDERNYLVNQIRKAALSVVLNLAEGSARISQLEKKRFYEISRGSLVEIDSALDVAAIMGYCDKNILTDLGAEITLVYKLICGLIRTNTP